MNKKSLGQTKSLPGQITVFLALSLMVIISLVLSTVSSARFYVIKNSQRQSVQIAARNLLAEYCIPLQSKYHLFAIDGNGRSLEHDLQAYVLMNQEHGFFGGTNTGVAISKLYPLSHQQYSPLRKEIVQYMENAGLVDMANEFLKNMQTQGIEDADKNKNQISAQVKAENEIALEQQNNLQQEEQSGEQMTDSVEDPRKSFMDVLKDGILTLVLPKNYSISQSSISSGSSATMVETLTDFLSADKLTEKIDAIEFSLTNMAGTAVEEVIIALYIREYFNHGANTENSGFNTKLKYELEYIVCGHQSDRDNLLDMVNRLALLRMVFNMPYLLADPIKSQEAHGVALALSSAIFMPFLETVFYWLLVAAWSYAEAIMDVRTLISGETVPLIKNSVTWKLSLRNMAAELLQSADTAVQENTNQGLKYEDYLTFFVLTTSQENKYRRMMDLMEVNVSMEEGYENFSINDCYYGLSCLASFEIRPFFNLFSSLDTTAHGYSWSECY